MTRRFLVIVIALGIVAVPGIARASHSLVVSTERKALLLSPTQVLVRGSLTCIGEAESGSIGVVVVPIGSVTQAGGGSTPFSCEAGETQTWRVVVEANSFSTFSKGRITYDTFAFTSCSDTETDCPSAGNQGILRIKAPKA